MGDVLGYARVSTGDQDVAGQTLRLERAGALKVFTDVRSGKTMERPGLEALLAYSRKGDTLAVVRLDRLGIRDQCFSGRWLFTLGGFQAHDPIGRQVRPNFLYLGNHFRMKADDRRL